LRRNLTRKRRRGNVIFWAAFFIGFTISGGVILWVF
jgi:hypothetical protein